MSFKTGKDLKVLLIGLGEGGGTNTLKKAYLVYWLIVCMGKKVGVKNLSTLNKTLLMVLVIHD